jgi:hypothetical protein
LALAGVGALGAMALLIPGGAGAAFNGSGKYSGAVNGAQSNAQVGVVPSGSKCKLAANNYASVLDVNDKNLGTATQVVATLRDGSNSTVDTVTITAYGSGGRKAFSTSANAPCSGSGSVTFTPNGTGGTTDTLAVTFSQTYTPPA